jgi:hypothetical protein
MKRILDSELSPRLDDGPMRRSLVTKDPSIDVFGFNNENTKLGDDKVVNLSRTIFRWYRQIVQREVNRIVKKNPVCNGTHHFANPAFEKVGKRHGLITIPQLKNPVDLNNRQSLLL